MCKMLRLRLGQPRQTLSSQEEKRASAGHRPGIGRGQSFAPEDIDRQSLFPGDLRMRRQLLCLCFLITFASLAPAFADSFTIFSTGVDSSGTPLANNSQDTHWTLVTVTGPVSPYVITQANGFPDPPWNANDSASAWIN